MECTALIEKTQFFNINLLKNKILNLINNIQALAVYYKSRQCDVMVIIALILQFCFWIPGDQAGYGSYRLLKITVSQSDPEYSFTSFPFE